MLGGRSYVEIAAAAVLVAAAISPGCSSTIEGVTTSTSTGSGGASTTSGGTSPGGGGHGGAAGGASASSSTGGTSGGSGGGPGGGATGGGGASSCALCVAAFDHTNPAPPSSLCTDNGPESSKQYFDAFVTCCDTSCASQCDCAQPYGILSGLCQLCRGQHCDAETIACGLCESCASVLQGTGNLDNLCTAGATPSASDLWAALAQCACSACPQACADDACMGSVLGDACLACAQDNCPTELQSCASDDTPTSG